MGQELGNGTKNGQQTRNPSGHTRSANNGQHTTDWSAQTNNGQRTIDKESFVGQECGPEANMKVGVPSRSEMSPNQDDEAMEKNEPDGD